MITKEVQLLKEALEGKHPTIKTVDDWYAAIGIPEEERTNFGFTAALKQIDEELE